MTAKFWIGGTGAWDNTNDANWSLSSGGANNTTHPTSGDTATFDASSGGGTVTGGAVTLTLQSITCGAFTGTLDFSANNTNVTLSVSFDGSGSGTRTLNLGNGTWTLSATTVTNIWSLSITTGLTFNANSSVISLTGNAAGSQSRNFIGGGVTYATVQIGAAAGPVSVSGTNTFGTFLATGAAFVTFAANQTITNLNLSGSSGSPVTIQSGTLATQRTLTITTLSATWATFRSIVGSGTATSSLDLGFNSGITITPPASGGILVNRGLAGGMNG